MTRYVPVIVDKHQRVRKQSSTEQKLGGSSPNSPVGFPPQKKSPRRRGVLHLPAGPTYDLVVGMRWKGAQVPPPDDT